MHFTGLERTRTDYVHGAKMGEETLPNHSAFSTFSPQPELPVTPMKKEETEDAAESSKGS